MARQSVGIYLHPPAHVCHMAARRALPAGEAGGVDGATMTWPLPNVWLGVSVEDQHRAEERIPTLLATPAARRFVSYEPALGPVDLAPWLPGIDWLIAGGETVVDLDRPEGRAVGREPLGMGRELQEATMSAGCFTCGAKMDGETAELLCWCDRQCRDACPPGVLRTLGRWRYRWNVEILDGHGDPALVSALHDLAGMLTEGRE